jgi:hypothetical protein
MGIVARGKGIEATSGALAVILVVARGIAPETNVHSTIPVYANSGYGTPSVGTLSTAPNTTVYTASSRSGRPRPHRSPRAV